MNLYQAKPSLLLVDQSARAEGAPSGLPAFPSYYVRDRDTRVTTVLDAKEFELLRNLIRPTRYSALLSQHPGNELNGIFEFLQSHDLLLVNAATNDTAQLLEASDEEGLKGIPLVPRTIMMNCTPKCNLLCRHCIVSEKHHKKQELLSFDNLAVFLDDIDSHGVENLILSGGEPLLWQSITKILEDSLNRSFTVILYTNGMIINEKWLALFKKIHSHKPGGLQIHISLDGATPATHDGIRGVNGSFNKIISSLELLKRADIPVASIESMATSDLFDELEALISICQDYSIKSLYLHPVFNFDRDSNIQELELDYNTRVNFLRKVEELSTNDYGMEVLYRDPYFPTGLFREQSHSKKEVELFLNSMISGNKEVMNNFIISEKKPETLVNCDGGTSQMFVDFTGDVYPCMIYANAGKTVDHCGNVKQSTLMEIWNSHGMKRARTTITKEELTACSRCDFFDKCGDAVKKCRIGSEIALNDFYGPSYLCVKYAKKLDIPSDVIDYNYLEMNTKNI